MKRFWKSKRIKEIYHGMKKRCYNNNAFAYNDYGGRGITICDEWLNSPEKFQEWALNNGYSDELTIDRIDNNKGYSPDNCRFATAKEQGNNKRNNHLITYNGETHTLAEWASICGVDRGILKNRIMRDHIPFEKAILNENLRKRKINMYLPKSHKLVNTFDSVREASAYVTGNVKGAQCISSVANSPYKTVYGFSWGYAD